MAERLARLKASGMVFAMGNKSDHQELDPDSPEWERAATSLLENETDEELGLAEGAPDA